MAAAVAMRRRRGLLRVALAVVVLAAVAWSAGLFWFIGTTRRSFEPPPHTDGIVALTGGAGRVELALRLLADGRADRLLLSGIGGGSDLVRWAGWLGSRRRRWRGASPWGVMRPRRAAMG